MDIRAVFCRGHARTIEDAVAGLEARREKSAFKEAELAHYAELLVSACVVLEDCLQDWQQEAWKALFSGEFVEVQATGEELQDAYDKALAGFHYTENCVSGPEGRGFVIEGAEQFRQAHEQVKALAADFKKRWPLFDLAELEQARERADRGESLSAEEFRRALLGHD